jgi:hypothetical protein
MKELVSWEAPEYTYYRRNADWYWWTGIIAFGLLVFAIVQRSFLFGVLIVVGWFTVMLYALRVPGKIKVIISDQGIQIEKNLYPWRNLESFWIFARPANNDELSLKSKKTFSPFIKIPLGSADQEELKEIIKKFLPEAEQEESLIDNLSNLAKF